MAEDTVATSSSNGEENAQTGNKEEKNYCTAKSPKASVKDTEIFCCLLQPASPNSDPDYVGIRRLLLFRKAESGHHHRLDWRFNGKGYVAYRNYIRKPRTGESSQAPSYPSTPGHSGRWLSSPNPFSYIFEVDNWTCSRDIRNGNPTSNPRTSFSSIASDSSRRRVTVLKFGHMSSDLLAYGSSDGTLTVCTVSERPSVVKELSGHSKDVTDFDFSSNNQYIASSSMDKTVRVWELSKGICIRVIYGVSSQLCIRFHPVNNNFLSVGNGSKEITVTAPHLCLMPLKENIKELFLHILVFNFSTGRTITRSVFDSEVTSMDHDHTGHFIFCGDAQGCIYSVSMDSYTGALSRSHHHKSSSTSKSPVTTVQYRSFSLLPGGSMLLTCTQDGNLSFFSVALEVQGYLTFHCSLKLSPRIHSIQAAFCPLLSLEKGEYIVAGSEDSNVYFYDLTRPRHACVNKLQGHRFPVVGVAWNYGENLLASSDIYGVVIVWKRAKTS